MPVVIGTNGSSRRAIAATVWLASAFVLRGAQAATAQERPYFVTYDDHVEDRGELGVAMLATSGRTREGEEGYVAPWLEIEYGITWRWTTELYLEGVTIGGNGSAFSGWRMEHRYRPFDGDHAINPVLYVEYEQVNDASRIQKEIVGTGPLPRGPIDGLVHERSHELEGKLILSSYVGAWNASANAIIEKNLSEQEGIEFGYAAAMSRPVGRAWVIGAEAYGGLGSTISAPFDDTRHFIAPLAGWRVTPASLLRASVGFGLTTISDRFLVRIGYSIDVR